MKSRKADKKGPFFCCKAKVGTNLLFWANPCRDAVLTESDAQALVKWLNARWPKGREWVSVGERLPPDGMCLTWNGHSTHKAYFRGTAAGFLDYHNITHWMPLPDPPKADCCVDEPCDCGCDDVVECEEERICRACGHWGPSADCGVLCLTGPSIVKSRISSVHAGFPTVFTSAEFGCVYWKPKDCQCEQRTHTTQDIREIARDELKLSVRDAVKAILQQAFSEVARDVMGKV